MNISTFMKLNNLNLETSSNFTFKNFGLLISNKKETISFLVNEEFIDEAINNKNIIAIVTSKRIADSNKLNNLNFIYSDTPLDTFYKLYNIWAETNHKKVKTVIGKNTNIHNSTIIPEYNVKIGDNTVIEEYVVIKENVEIGSNCIIRTGTILGCESFDVKKIDGINKRTPHNGNVKIYDNVEIQVNSIIDQGIYGESTKVGKNSILGHQVHIGHNSTVGNNCVIGPNVLLSGYTEIEDNVYIAPKSTTYGQLKIGEGSRITISTNVQTDIPKNQTVTQMHRITSAIKKTNK